MPGDVQGLDVSTILALLSGGSTAVGAPFIVYMLSSGKWVRGSELEEAKKTIAEKDAQLTALNQANVDKVVPALAQSALIMEKFHTETTVRRTE